MRAFDFFDWNLISIYLQKIATLIKIFWDWTQRKISVLPFLGISFNALTNTIQPPTQGNPLNAG